MPVGPFVFDSTSHRPVVTLSKSYLLYPISVAPSSAGNAKIAGNVREDITSLDANHSLLILCTLLRVDLEVPFLS